MRQLLPVGGGYQLIGMRMSGTGNRVEDINVFDPLGHHRNSCLLADPHRWQHVKSFFLNEGGNQRGLNQRRLARARLRVQKYYRMRGDKRSQLVSFLIAPKKKFAITFLERPWSNIWFVISLHSSSTGSLAQS